MSSSAEDPNERPESFPAGGRGGVAADEARAERHAGGLAPPAPGAAGPPASAPAPVTATTTARRPPHPDALAYFVPEAAEHLEVMSACLLALEQGRGARDELATLFRAVHTLKGAAYVVGATAVGDLAHRLEDILAAIQMGRLSVSPAVIEGFHAAVDALRRVLGAADGSPWELSRAVDEAVGRLDALEATSGMAADESRALGGAPAPGSSSPGPVDRAPVPASPGARPARRRGGERLEGLLSLAGELVTARTRLDLHLRQLDRLGEQLTSSGTRMAKAVGDFEARTRLEAGVPPGSDNDGGGGRPLPDAPPSRLPRAESIGRTLLARPVTELFAALELDRYDESDLLTRRAREIAADLSVVQSHLAGVRRLLAQDGAQIQRLTGSLRTQLLRARLVPIRRLFSRVGRQIREFASAEGKTVTVELSGEAVEVDSLIVERMADPILHLVRNAIVHGIESPDERQTRGKPPHGTVSLGAVHRGGWVHVEVRDDGRGIDPERLKEHAVRHGLLPPEVAQLLDGPEALDLIFLPGLSTAALVTPAAGRGVGMDAVRASVGALNGEIAVATELGVGTRFTVKLPLAVTASHALLVRVGTETLAIPLNAIKRVLRLPPERILSAGPGERIRMDDQLLELIRLDRVLGLAPPDPMKPIPVVVLGAAGEPAAVTIGELLGKEEIVIKGLGEFLDGIGPFAGATVSAEGRVILVLDPVRLRDTARALAVATAGPPPAPPAPLEPLEPFEPADALPATPAVLLVDDSISVRKFVGQMLERAGFAVLTACDGAEALALLAERTVALMITDLEMPRLNGFELIQELRRRPATRDLPVIVLTTRVGAQHLNLARWLGVTDYVPKPVDEPAFVRLIDSLARPPFPRDAAPISAAVAAAGTA